MYLARRLGEKVVKKLRLSMSSKCSVFSTISNTYLIPSLLLVQINMTTFTENEHESFGTRSSTSMTDFANLI